MRFDEFLDRIRDVPAGASLHQQSPIFGSAEYLLDEGFRVTGLTDLLANYMGFVVLRARLAHTYAPKTYDLSTCQPRVKKKLGRP